MGFLHCDLPEDYMARQDIFWSLVNPKLSDTVTNKEIKRFLKEMIEKAIVYPMTYFDNLRKMEERNLEDLNKEIKKTEDSFNRG